MSEDRRLRIDASDYLTRSYAEKGVGGWRALFLKFVIGLRPESVLEAGAGAPDFLANAPAARRVALDVGDRYSAAFQAAGIEFLQRDLDREGVGAAGFDVVICSDVFEHLLNPAFALASLREAMSPCGVLLSHVPNEFRLRTIAVMLGRRPATMFHADAQEWNDPHLRRFTDCGYRAFLQTQFKHNVRLTELRYEGPARLWRALGQRAPYFLEGGPTYASTNDLGKMRCVIAIKRRLSRAGPWP